MIMICVVEYGKHIGTLRNIFPDRQQALAFAQRIIALSDGEYQSIGQHQWYCREKKEFVKIEAMRN